MTQPTMSARPLPRPLILASQSPARAGLLAGAGVPFEAFPARVDEAAVKAGMLAEGAPPRDIADTLAELKAQRLAHRVPEALVLGADQVLVCDGEIFDKPADEAAARAQLLRLRGRPHELLSAAVVFEGGAPVWRHVGRARLVMRDFSDAFLDDYLAAEGEALLDTVGAYRLEGRGAQLFSQVEGDHFAILGLPLLELLDFLRTRGVVAP
jgi:septum formation protein